MHVDAIPHTITTDITFALNTPQTHRWVVLTLNSTRSRTFSKVKVILPIIMDSTDEQIMLARCPFELAFPFLKQAAHYSVSSECAFCTTCRLLLSTRPARAPVTGRE